MNTWIASIKDREMESDEHLGYIPMGSEACVLRRRPVVGHGALGFEKRYQSARRALILLKVLDFMR